MEKLEKKLYTVNEAGYILSLAPITLRKWIQHNRIQSVPLGRARRIPADEIDRVAKEGLTKMRKNVDTSLV